MTQIGGLPVGAGMGVLHGVGGIFGKIEKGFAKENTPPPAPDIPSGQASHPTDQPNTMLAAAALSAFPVTNGNEASKEPGTLRVTVIAAKDLAQNDVKPYCSLRIGDKEQKTKHANKTAAPEW